VRRLAAALATRQTPDFEAWESLLLQAARQGGAGVLGTLLSHWQQHAPREVLLCQCGRRMSSRGRRGKGLLTTLGRVPFARSFYQCPPCSQGRFPDDQRSAEAVMHLLTHRLDTIEGEYVVLGDGSFRGMRQRRSPPGMLDRLRKSGILYDRSASGEYLHIYTETFADRFFFEIVQRIDAYDGYGALNSPARMASQAQESSR